MSGGGQLIGPAKMNANTAIPTTASETTRRQIWFVAIGDLVPDRDNPRKHGRAQIMAIARSIDAFGFNAPILIDWNRCRSWPLRSGKAPGLRAGHRHLP